MKERVYCLNHPNTYAVNAKKLCGVCTKARHEKSAESKGLTIKKKDDVFDNTRRNTEENSKNLVRTFRSENRTSAKNWNTKKKTKIKSVSKDKAKELLELAKIKKAKTTNQGSICEMCSKQGEVDLFHIIPVGNKKFSTNPINLILSCRDCHDIWGANDWSKIVKFKNFDEIMERLKFLDEGKYWKLKHKIDKYYEQENINTNKD